MNMRQLISRACVVLLTWPAIAPAGAEIFTWGTLAPAEDELRGVYDWELADLIAQKIGTDADILIVNGACYGGDFLDNFNSTPGQGVGGAAQDPHNFSNTTIVTGTVPGQPTYDHGWHRNAVRRLVPGYTAQDIKDARGFREETPQSQGDLNKPVGGASSTHILAWAGQPSDVDRQDLEYYVPQHFKDDPNTTIHALANNDPASGPTDGVVTGPATLEALENALDEIAQMMGPGEQFILYIGDHGDIHKVRDSHIVPGEDNATSYIPMTVPVLDHMAYDPSNVPAVILYFDPSTPTAEIELLSLSLNSNAPVSLSDPGWHVDSIVLPGNNLAQTYTYQIPESFFDVFAELSPASPGQVVEVFNAGINPIHILFTELGSGHLARLPVPEPTGIVIMTVSLYLAGFAGRRRSREMSAAS